MGSHNFFTLSADVSMFVNPRFPFSLDQSHKLLRFGANYAARRLGKRDL